MTDLITLNGLRVFGRHGVYDFEREQGQEFVVDVVLELDLTRPAGTDDVADTVHYGQLAETLASIVGGEPVNLIERLADRLVRACLAYPQVEAATVTVHKPSAPIRQAFADVSVTMRRCSPSRLGARVVLSLGSNLGDRLAHLRDAVSGLSRLGRATVSPVYETPPWGDPDQPHYLNAVLVLQTAAPAHEVLAVGARLEAAAGRVRDPDRRFGPRPLDVDVLAAWDGSGEAVTSDDPQWTLPHPRAHLRAFVLRPWLDLDPGAVLPGHGSVAQLLAEEPVAGDLATLVRRDDLRL